MSAVQCPLCVDAFRMAQEYQHGFTIGQIADARGLTAAETRRAIQRCGVRIKEKVKDE